MTNETITAFINSHLADREHLDGICALLFPTPVYWSAEHMEMTCVFEVTKQMANPGGNLHGGMIATIFDNGLGILAGSFSDCAYTPTVTLNVEYLRPVPLPGKIYVRGKIVKCGRTLIHVRGELLDSEHSEKPYAVASAVYYKKR